MKQLLALKHVKSSSRVCPLQVIYGNLFVSSWDRQYLATVTRQVLTALSTDTVDVVAIGNEQLPVPL